MSKKAEFLEYCRGHKYISSIAARDWGAKNGFLRAERALREFGEAGICERLNWAQKIDAGLIRPEQTDISWCKF